MGNWFSNGETSKRQHISETEKTASGDAVLSFNGEHEKKEDLTPKKSYPIADTDSASLPKETTDSACSLKEEENVASAFNVASDQLPRDHGDVEGSPIQATSNPAIEIRDESPGELTTTQDTTSNSSVEKELYRAADERISELNKVGVAQGRTDINEPKRHHIPRIINMEEFEDWIKHAKEYAVDRRLKRRGDRVVGKEIDLNDIFDDVSTQDGSMKECRHVIVLAPAGMGKTTLLRWIAQYGRQGALKKLGGKLIVMPDFRTLPTDKKLHPSQALLGTMLKDQDAERMKQRYQWMLENPDEVVFLIDSLDTLAFDFDTERPRIGHNTEALPEDILYNLLSRDLFPNSNIVSTSREFKVRNMHPNVRPDRCLLLDGLKEESVQDLIGEFLGEEKGEEVKRHIKMECPDVGPLLVMPVFLVFGMIGFVAGGFIPNTMSGILIKYYLTLILSNHAQVKNIREALVKLMPMAFNSILKGQVLFSLEHFNRFGIILEEVTDLGILIPFSTGNYLFSKLMQVDGFYLYFNHQTLQECLAALHLLSIDVTKYLTLIKTNLFKPNFIVVRRILCGTLLNSEVLEATKKLMHIPDVDRKKLILLESLRCSLEEHNTDGKRLLEILIDLNEGKSGVTELIQSSVKHINIQNTLLSSSEVQCVAFVMKQCRYLQSVELPNCGLSEEKMEILSRSLKQSNVKVHYLNVSSNNLGPDGMLLLSKLLKNCEVKAFNVSYCQLRPAHIKELRHGCDGLKLERVSVGGNSEIGCDGMVQLGRFARDSEFQELDIHACKLQSEHLQRFTHGAENAKLMYLDVSDNAQLGPEGMFFLGKIVNKHRILHLNASRCNPKSEHLRSLTRGLDSTTLQSLDLGDFWAKPAPTDARSLLELLLHVEGKLDLKGWKIGADDRQMLFNEIKGKSVSIILGDDHLQDPTTDTSSGSPTRKQESAIPKKYLPVSRKLPRGDEKLMKIPISVCSKNRDILLKVLGKKEGGKWTEVRTIPLHLVQERIVTVETGEFSHFTVAVLDSIEALFGSSHKIFAKGEVNIDHLGNFEAKFRGSTEFDPDIDNIAKNRMITLFHEQEFQRGDKIEFSIHPTGPTTEKFQFNCNTNVCNVDSNLLRPGKTVKALLRPKPESEDIEVQCVVKRNGTVIADDEFRIPFQVPRSMVTSHTPPHLIQTCNTPGSWESHQEPVHEQSRKVSTTSVDSSGYWTAEEGEIDPETDQQTKEDRTKAIQASGVSTNLQTKEEQSKEKHEFFKLISSLAQTFWQRVSAMNPTGTPPITHNHYHSHYHHATFDESTHIHGGQIGRLAAPGSNTTTIQHGTTESYLSKSDASSLDRR